MDKCRDFSWRRSGVWAPACAALVLLAACGAQSPPPASSPARADNGSAAPATSPAAPPPGRRADAPPPVPVPTAGETSAGGEVKAPVASITALKEHALAVRTYGAEDPSRCGLKPPRAAVPPSSVQVFFGCTPASGPVVGAVPARVMAVPSGTKPERAAIEALLAGPTAEEKQAGYVSNFGDASRGAGVDVELRNDGTAVVNFDQAVRERGRAFVSNLDTRQVVATLGQFPGVERVLILIEGEPLCKALGEC